MCVRAFVFFFSGYGVRQVPDGFEEPRITQGQEPQASCVPHCYTQEVSLLCNLPPGAYAVVPSTYQPDSEGNFTLTVCRRILRYRLSSGRKEGQPVNQYILFCSVSHKHISNGSLV